MAFTMSTTAAAPHSKSYRGTGPRPAENRKSPAGNLTIRDVGSIVVPTTPELGSTTPAYTAPLALMAFFVATIFRGLNRECAGPRSLSDPD
jgi:hypothetical protein